MGRLWQSKLHVGARTKYSFNKVRLIKYIYIYIYNKTVLYTQFNNLKTLSARGCFQSANTSVSQQLIRTRSKYPSRTNEPFSSPVNITKYQIWKLWLLSMWTTDANLGLTNQKLSWRFFLHVHTYNGPLFAQGLLIAVRHALFIRKTLAASTLTFLAKFLANNLRDQNLGKEVKI
jgi:hypothetical protein